jgi:hypothetical protein
MFLRFAALALFSFGFVGDALAAVVLPVSAKNSLPTASQFAAHCDKDFDWCQGRIMEIFEIDAGECKGAIPTGAAVMETILRFIQTHPATREQPYDVIARRAIYSRWPCTPPKKP